MLLIGGSERDQPLSRMTILHALVDPQIRNDLDIRTTRSAHQ